MEAVDLGPAARHMSDLVVQVGDDQLGARTPAGESTVADLLDHVGGLALAFAAAAAKDLGPLTATPPAPDGTRLGERWREEFPRRLEALAAAWADPAAWGGMTTVGGVELPGAVAGRIALDELVLHAWDIARATGQPYRPDPASLRACHAALLAMYPADDLPSREGIFAPPVPVPDDAPLVDRVVAFSGRDPAWA
jgi:uncharacterized protein (TIGR03086 family)